MLAFSLRSLEKERDRLRQGFVDAREVEVRDLASDLEDRLRDLEENARVIETLVEKMHAAPPAEHDDRTKTLRASFDAMATVIRHYRTLVLLGPTNCDPVVVAVDPTEIPSTAKALIDLSCAPSLTLPRVKHLARPVQMPDRRASYLYSFPVGTDTVVISIEGSSLLQSAFRSLPDSQLVVTDPHGAEWVSSGASLSFELRASSKLFAARKDSLARFDTKASGGGLRPPERGGVRGGASGSGPPPRSMRRAEEESSWNGLNGLAWISELGSHTLELPPGPALASWASAQSAGLGVWRVLMIRSGRSLESRQRALVRQTILTAAGLLVAIGSSARSSFDSKGTRRR